MKGRVDPSPLNFWSRLSGKMWRSEEYYLLYRVYLHCGEGEEKAKCEMHHKTQNTKHTKHTYMHMGGKTKNQKDIKKY